MAGRLGGQDGRLPPARLTNALAVACLLLQLVPFLLGPGFDRAFTFEYGLVPARLSGAVIAVPGATPPLLTLVTHIFLHGGFVHLLMNMLFLLWIGRQMEPVLGPFRLLGLFLLGGIAGGLAQVFADPRSMVPVLGASGAISALFAAYALLFARNSEAPATILGVRFSGETVRALRYAALWIGLQLLVGVAFNTPGAPGIAIWAHIGGFVAGLVLGLPLILSRRPASP
jgi:membrane associated rhomboid family serine protease